jgi:hypothetical protein
MGSASEACARVVDDGAIENVRRRLLDDDPCADLRGSSNA